MLRKHQLEVIEICKEINQGKPIDKVYLDCHPGSGKSGDSVLFAKYLIGTSVDKICHVAPRLSLVYQIEENMIDPFFESGRVIRVADNLPDPSRGLDGFSITYQAIARNSMNLIEDFQKHRYCLVLDENHHILSDGTWEEPLKKLIGLSKVTVFLTGTAFRGDGQPISYFPYKNSKFDKTPSENSRFITYTRSDALREQAIIPVKLNLIDGSGSYEKKGELIEYNTITREHLKAAVKSDYAFQVIDSDMVEFLEYRKNFPLAQMILVGTDIETSRSYASYIKDKWCRCRAVDSEMPNSVDIIKSFKKGDFPVLSSCGQAYEGLDVPNTSHMIIMTHIRSEPWLTQCINRATRYRPWKDYAYITAPADPDFQMFFKSWIWEQEQCLKDEDTRTGGGNGQGGTKPEIEILHGEAHLPPSTQEKLLRTEMNFIINSYISEKSKKIIDGELKFVHTESLRRRKILWYRIYAKIGRRCQLKEMTYEEMEIAKIMIEDLCK